MSEHTAGYIRVDGSGIRLRTADDTGQPRSGKDGGNKLIATVTEQFMDRSEREANAHRLADCWNAFAGIADPAAYLAELRESHERLRAACQQGLPWVIGRCYDWVGEDPPYELLRHALAAVPPCESGKVVTQ